MKTSDLIWQDEQHQELLAIIDQLKQDPSVGHELMERLTDYVNHHFSLEEKYMELTGYPNMQAHVLAHKHFTEKIEKLKISPSIIDEGFKDPEFRAHITTYLSDWLISHVLGIDKELETHIMQSRFK
ncbi:MAG: hemerythrin family protein [Gammaproteobacteria bacterium]|nr:hemerythrin family protein [Gammaproteobacteria bacterium]